VDPPWDLRVGLRYPTMKDELIYALPMNCLQDVGHFFVWIVNSKEEMARRWVYWKIKVNLCIALAKT
jgi:N6-adenosine-specific RNA methylase IME4